MITLETILCPVDLSEISRAALGYAIVLARQYAASLRVLSVVAAPSWPPALTPPAVAGLTIEMRKLLTDELEQLVQPALAAGIPTDVHLEEGYVVAEILDGARSQPADMIVMGTHGRGGFDRLVLGSVAEKVVRKATCPVLTVPPGADASMTPQLRTIVCAVDFSDPSARALDYAVSLATGAHATLILVNVLDWPATRGRAGAHVPSLDGFRREWEAEAEKELRQLVPDDIRRTVRVEQSLAVGKPSDEIVHLARDTSADLIVLGVHGRGALERAMLGSTAHHVIRHAHCPVLTVPLA